LISLGRPCVAQRVWPIPHLTEPLVGGLPDLFLQRFNPADRTDDLGLPFVDNGDTTGIVAPVFEPFQAID